MRYKKIIYGLTIPLTVAIFLVIWLRWPNMETEQVECCDMGVTGLAQANFCADQVDGSRLLFQISPSEKVELIYNSVIASKERLSFSVKNVSGSEFIYRGERQVLAKCVNGRWRTVQPLFATLNGLCNNIIRRYNSEVWEYNIGLAWYGNLLPGRYMFVVSFLSSPREYIFIEFTI